MGTYVYFSLGGVDGVKTQLLDDFAVYLGWFQNVAEEFPDEYSAALRAKMLDISLRGDRALEAASDEEAHLIDRVVDEYWNFCDMKGMHPERDITPSAHRLHRYVRDLSEIIPTASDAAKRYYAQIFEGRSLSEFSGHRYVSADKVFHVSWLLPDEADELLAELEPYEDQLMSGDEASTGVVWVLESLRRVTREGLSLVVTIG